MAMDAADEIKPAIEWIGGRPEQKVSPQRRHGILQWRLAKIVADCAGDRGDVASEWRFDFPRASRRTSLVPDVAFASYERLRMLDDELAEQPPFAPDIAIEIRSRYDRPGKIGEKIALYLQYGTTLVLDVDPSTQSVTAHSLESATFSNSGTFAHAAVPWLTFDIAALFRGLEIPR